MHGSVVQQRCGSALRVYAASVNAPRPLRADSASRAALAVGLVGGIAGTLGGELQDLWVYQHGGQAVLDGVSPYATDDPVNGLPFTYPPFAAALMVPLALLPAWLVAGLWSGASAGALGASVVVARRAVHRTTPAWLVVLVSIAAVALEPVWQNLAFGQVNLLLMLVVLMDVLRPERRLSGVALGIAAGVKLTPLVFVVLLALTGHRAAAGRAVVAFGLTVALGFAVMPGPSMAYWSDRLLEASRVGPPGLAHNQSIYGALTRLLDSVPSTLVWLAVARPVTAVVLYVAAVCWRHGDRLLSTCLGAMAMLLASPVAWSHHWVWAVPVALVLWQRNRWVSVAWTSVFLARPILWPPWGDGREFGWGPAEQLVGSSYLLAALALTAWASRTIIGAPTRT